MHATVLSSYIQCLAKQIPTLYISALLFIRAEPTTLRTNTSQEIYLELNTSRRQNAATAQPVLLVLFTDISVSPPIN
jgi:hypothetical protein